MRNALLLAIAITGLCGCANESERLAAAVECQSVGITQRDPQYDTCMRAYTLQARQDTLETTYHRAANPVPDRKIPHQWYGF